MLQSQYARCQGRVSRMLNRSPGLGVYCLMRVWTTVKTIYTCNSGCHDWENDIPALYTGPILQRFSSFFPGKWSRAQYILQEPHLISPLTIITTHNALERLNQNKCHQIIQNPTEPIKFIHHVVSNNTFQKCILSL